MKKVLSVILSLAIVVSSVGSTCFAQEEKTSETNLSKEIESAPSENAIITELKELLDSETCKGQKKLCEQLLSNASASVDQKNIDIKETKMVRYGHFSLIFNLLKLVTVDLTEISVKLCFYTLMLLYAPSKALVKLGFQVIVYVAKVIGRTPKAVLYMLKGKLGDSELEKQCKEFLEDMSAEMN